MPTAPWPPDTATLQALFERPRLQRGRQLLGQILELQADGQGASARVQGSGERVFELVVQGAADAEGRPHYSALCSCRTRRFCEHAAAVMLKLRQQADAPLRANALHLWVEALRRKAGRDELKALPKLPEADAAQLMDLLLADTQPPAPPAAPVAPAPAPVGEPAQFRPRLTLRTLTRGDGLLGLAPETGKGKLGPRGDAVTVAQVDWTYRASQGLAWDTPAPVRC